MFLSVSCAVCRVCSGMSTVILVKSVPVLARMCSYMFILMFITGLCYILLGDLAGQWSSGSHAGLRNLRP